MRPLRVLVANWTDALVGGAESYLARMIPGLAGCGHEVALLIEHLRPWTGGTISASARVPVLRYDGSVADALAASARWSPDVVLQNGVESPELEAALVHRFPAILIVHSYVGCCVTGTKRHAFPTPVPCRRRFGIACLPLHYARRCGGLNPVTTLVLYRTQSARRALFGAYRAVLTNSEHMAQEVRRHGAPADRVFPLPAYPHGRIPLGVVADRGPGNRVCFVGRMTEFKGGELLVDALPLASARLGRELVATFVGDGPQRAAWSARARRRGARVRFAGWLSGSDLEETLRGADVLAVPSTWPEPFGMVGLEAQTLGIPAVGFAAGGVPEWLVPGKTGELAPADPPTALGLSDALVRVLSDPAHYRRLAEGALEHSRHHTVEEHVTNLTTHLRRVVG